MPTVDINRLKGNFGAAYVAARLSSECLVRPVAADTDVGVDLYCETIEHGNPFLHFWVQVKAGAQCKLSESGAAASCSFRAEHLSYWCRQPVPVFAALVPVDWPVRDPPTVYIVDVTLQMLGGNPRGAGDLTLESNYIWRPDSPDDLQQFLSSIVPATSARLRCKHGTVTQIPTLLARYEQKTPFVPVTQFKKEIQDQIRKTAALSVLFLWHSGHLNSDPEFRRLLASIVAQFRDDPHWENYMAMALSSHADDEFDRAVDLYNGASQSIEKDFNLRKQPSWPEWEDRIAEISNLAQKAMQRETL